MHSLPLIFLSGLIIAFEAKLITNSAKLPLAKEIARSVGTFFPKLSNKKPKDPPY